jgi:hypothetical protein
MSIVIEDAQVQRLAEQLAGAKGVSVAEVVREGLLFLAGRREPSAAKPPLRERLAALAREIDGLPPRTPPDARGDDEILGYNEHGAW